MSNQDTDFEEQISEETIDDTAADAPESVDLVENAASKKKSGGAFFYLVLCLLVFAAAFFGMRHLGVQLPTLIAQLTGSQPPADVKPAVTPSAETPATTAQIGQQPPQPASSDPLAAPTDAASTAGNLPSAVMMDPLATPSPDAAPAVAATSEPVAQPSATISAAASDTGLGLPDAMPAMPVDNANVDNANSVVAPVEPAPAATPAAIAPVSAEVATAPDALAVPPIMPSSVKGEAAPEPAVKSGIDQDILAAPANTNSAAEAAATAQKFGDLESRLGRLESGLEEIKAMLAQNTAAQDIAGLKESVASLEERIKSQKNMQARAEAVEDVRRGYALPRHAPPSVASAPRKPAAKSVATSSIVQWQLKSAKPGKAWLSSAGSGEITMVQTGDLLPGVGRVTAIDRDQMTGKWYVQVGARKIIE